LEELEIHLLEKRDVTLLQCEVLGFCVPVGTELLVMPAE
jgi:hypothetical protein